MEAALKGSQQIGFTIISLTISLIAVLIPLLFMGDVVGRLFHEFAITLAVSIPISAVVSLTLTPMLCARLLRHTPEDSHGRLYRATGHFLTAPLRAMAACWAWVLNHRAPPGWCLRATLALTVVLYLFIPWGFFPVQDTGTLQATTEADQSDPFADGRAPAGRGRSGCCKTRPCAACRRSSASMAPTPRSTPAAC